MFLYDVHLKFHLNLNLKIIWCFHLILSKRKNTNLVLTLKMYEVLKQCTLRE